MSLATRGFLSVNGVLHESRRFRAKVNVKRPQLPHFQKKLALNVCTPIIPRKHVWEICRLNEVDKRKQEVHNPLEDILAKECLNWFSHCRMIAFIHINPISMEYKLPFIQDLAFEHMYVRQYARKIIDKAIIGTIYEPCTKLFVSHNEMIFSENVNVQNLLNILKKTPQLVLLAGIIEGRLLSRNDFVNYAKLPSIDVMRSQFCNTMQSAGSTIVRQLASPQSTLVNQLDQYMKLKQDESEMISLDTKPESSE